MFRLAPNPLMLRPAWARPRPTAQQPRGPKLISLKKRKDERPYGRSRTIDQRKHAPDI